MPLDLDNHSIGNQKITNDDGCFKRRRNNYLSIERAQEIVEAILSAQDDGAELLLRRLIFRRADSPETIIGLIKTSVDLLELSEEEKDRVLYLGQVPAVTNLVLLDLQLDESAYLVLAERILTYYQEYYRNAIIDERKYSISFLLNTIKCNKLPAEISAHHIVIDFLDGKIEFNNDKQPNWRWADES